VRRVIELITLQRPVVPVHVDAIVPECNLWQAHAFMKDSQWHSDGLVEGKEACTFPTSCRWEEQEVQLHESNAGIDQLPDSVHNIKGEQRVAGATHGVVCPKAAWPIVNRGRAPGIIDVLVDVVVG
jgi:hypothetical protein